MKTGNVILAIFLWLCIPGVFFLGAASSGISGDTEGGTICTATGVLIFFILGLVALLTGREK